MSLLPPFRVLDLTDERGFICGKLLADMGADVIKIEPSGGDPARKTGPFTKDKPHPENSLFWIAYNLNKRGITLNIETKDGCSLLKRLVEKADIIVESFNPGYMDGLGLGYKDLSWVNKGLVYTSISPFGQQGPYRDFKAPDLVGMALGGMIYLTGDADRRPVRITFPQAYLHAGAEAASASMMALYYRESTGEGQYVDVSMQQSLMLALLQSRLYWDINKLITYRAGPQWYRPITKTIQNQTWKCQDGYVSFSLFSGRGPAKSNKALVQWIDSENMATDFLKSYDWNYFDLSKVTQEIMDKLEHPIAEFFLKHTKQELYEGSIKRHIWLYPHYMPEDIMASRQLSARDFWIDVEQFEAGSEGLIKSKSEVPSPFRFPGAFIKSSEISCSIRRPAPRIGEHNVEIYQGELGLNPEQLTMLREVGAI